MKLNKSEVENLLNMLTSEDKDNAYVAFQAIEAFEFKKNEIGYLIYLYKFGKPDQVAWQENAPKSFKRLSKFFNMDEPLTYGKALKVMIENKSKSSILETFLERHVKQLVSMLDGMGYPVNSLDINIKLKE